MSGGVRATNRTQNAIRKADAAPRDQTSRLPKGSTPPSRGSGSSGRVRWAVIASSSDANNYVCNVYSSRGSFINSDDPIADNVSVRVPGIVDTLADGDEFPVVTSVIDGEDYECIQQMGAVG